MRLKERAYVTAFYFFCLALMSITLNVPGVKYLYSMYAYFGLGVGLILTGVLFKLTLNETFDFKERLAIIVPHLYSTLSIVFGIGYKNIMEFVYIYATAFMIAAFAYIILSMPSRFRGITITLR